MSRKYLNDKYCVRCGRKTACPYLRDNYDLITKNQKNLKVIDVGCGNGRNSEFMKQKGHQVVSVDMVNDYGNTAILGQDKLTVKDKSIDIILCNYLMMFLSPKERNQLISEFHRISRNNCIIMLELYPAKDCYAKTDEAMIKMQEQIFKKLGWNKIRYRKGKFIAENT